MVSHLKSKPEPGPGNRRASVDAAARREAKSPPPSPLTPDQAAVRDSLIGEHPGLHEKVATAAARNAAEVAGAGGEGADVILVNGQGREVSVHSGAFTGQGIGSHLQEEARQLGTNEVYLQINTAGASREALLGMIPEIRAGYPELDGLNIKFFGPDGEAWWEGPFRGPRE
jgi:hypothetical protein